ncbi:MAG TPA: hypothetical protein VMN43_11575 [Aestuariivirgaceae bacterium]|nr:hypothetical protein [Aestuariivirgaceae bacterium]
MGALLAFPLLLVALGVYNIIAFTAPASLDETAFELAMLSDAVLEEQSATATFFTLLAICLIAVIAGLAVEFRPGPQGLSMRAGS